MKGLIFVEFLNFVEQIYSYDMVDKLILKSHLPNDGAYTSIGTYDVQEFMQLVSTYSKEMKIPTHNIIVDYGKYLFSVFANRYPQFLQNKTTTFQFLASVQNYIHVDVKKFYADAELPSFQCMSLPPDQFIMIYTSNRKLADLAEGLILGCIKYHGEEIDVVREDIPVKKGAKAKFILTKRTVG